MDTFPASYAESRRGFLQSTGPVCARWPVCVPGKHILEDHPDLSIDWLWAEPRQKEHLVIVSTGQHGIEGYVGAAMLKLFIEEFAPRLDPENTGLLLVHAINPWGMQNNRKVDANGVDLNRNFDFTERFDPAINPEFKQIASLVNPQRPLGPPLLENISFWAAVLQALAVNGVAVVQKASLLGQHHTPNGFYYGGTGYSECTSVLIGLYRQALEEYRSVIQIDLHSGYGPRYQMSIVIPPLDPISSAAARQKFSYPLVQKIDRREFYAISGDMGEYFYRLRDVQYSGKALFACGFEFGSFGDSLLARIRSLRAMVWENQLHWHGAVSASAQAAVRHEFCELYFPAQPRWREKALADGRQAFQGILSAYRLL
jgi:hypothetical protein